MATTFVNLDTIQRPSSGLSLNPQWGDQVNDNFNVIWGMLTSNTSFRISGPEWNISGPVTVPSGAASYIGPAVIAAPAAQTVTLAGVVVFIRSAGSGTVTLSMEQNGNPVPGLTGIVASTTPSSLLTPSSTVTFADLDQFGPLVTAISGTPDGLTVAALLDITTS